MWSKIKKAFKKAWAYVKAAVRFVVRIVIFVVTFIVKIFDFLTGFLVAWPPKKMKVHIAVLQDQGVPLIKCEDLDKLLRPSIDLLKRVYKDYCNISVSPYSSGNEREIDNWAQILNDQPPVEALNNAACSLWTMNPFSQHQTGDAGEYFRTHLAGQVNGFQISLSFPITVFIVKTIGDSNHPWFGCTIPIFTDYVLVTVDALTKEKSTIAHEIGHRCNIFREYNSDPTNLMYAGNSPNLPPYKLLGWQRAFVRSSRHVTYK